MRQREGSVSTRQRRGGTFNPRTADYLPMRQTFRILCVNLCVKPAIVSNVGRQPRRVNILPNSLIKRRDDKSSSRRIPGGLADWGVFTHLLRKARVLNVYVSADFCLTPSG